ncbi:MAG TPA: hypothetical protein VM492_00590 [Sumerlaeia bacterium]|nr:hypothetical protein [Sumerlaeia bacterium]
MAIIAILAAIAVPNFLEAQVRSKVSRVKSDMRAMATAIESYATDHGRPPIGMCEYSNVTLLGWGGHRDICYSQLTTPVAYMTSIMHDPFGAKTTQENRAEAAAYFYQAYYAWGDGGYYDNMYPRVRAKGYTWSMYSLGPQMMEWPPWFEQMVADPQGYDALSNIYDSSNGTQSGGKIYRTSKGDLQGSEFDY